MKEYDVIVIGSGSGTIIVEQALAHGQTVALVDKGPFGGTCLNVGCIPSKILTAAADKVLEIQEASQLGVRAEGVRADFPAIMERMRKLVRDDQKTSPDSVRLIPGLDLYEQLGHFVDEYTMDVAGEKIRGRKIFIVSGARPLIPPLKGIDAVDYLTNETLLEISRKPETLIIVGGGYIAAEYGHFFSAMGTRVTILQRGARLLKEEEPEISAVLQSLLAKRLHIHTQAEALEVRTEGTEIKVFARDLKTGRNREFRAEKVLLAAGRESNADRLKLQNTGVEVDDRNFVRVNDYLETSRKNIWAAGDAIGQKMFKHAANWEADVAWRNAFHGEKLKVDLNVIPHAVFTHPEIASVGMGEKEAAKTYDILVGLARYMDVARGQALAEKDGLAKIIVEKQTGKILGFHIIGPDASILIQEVINAISAGATVEPLLNGLHIHPAMPELVPAAISRLAEPEES
ncbi:MAG: dihydrolipoyl dehydrogenase [Acidobacteriota bacterium]